MSDQTTDPSSPLMAALRGSLRVVENSDPESPLSEATANSINLLLEELNQSLVDGMPERITDEKLDALVDIFRARALTWLTEEHEKSTKTRAPRRQKGEVIDIIL